MDFGIQMNFNAEQPTNTLLSIRSSFESDSKVNDEREEQMAKHQLQRTPTENGIQTDSNASQWRNA
jgi:hypothetical protein